MLISCEGVDIDGVEAGLCTRSSGEEETIDIWKVFERKQQNGTDNSPANDVEVVESDKVESGRPDEAVGPINLFKIDHCEAGQLLI